jgi:hypothetical protein
LVTASGNKLRCNAGDVTCGEFCYNAQYQVCLKTASNNKIICDPGSIACGEGCYNPNSGDKCDPNNAPAYSNPTTTAYPKAQDASVPATTMNPGVKTPAQSQSGSNAARAGSSNSASKAAGAFAFVVAAVALVL